MTSLQKGIKYGAMAFAILLAVSIIAGIVGTVLSVCAFLGIGDAAGEMRTYPITEEVTVLRLETGAAELAVYTDGNFRVESNIGKLTVEVKDGVLTVHGNTQTWGTTGLVLELYIPAGTVFDRVEMQTGAGTVTVQELTAKTLELELGAGKAEIKNLTATDSADIEGGAGKLHIDGGALHGLEMDLGAGQVQLTSALSGRCTLDCGVGSVLLTLLGSEEEYTVRIDKGLGNATVGGKSAHDGDVFGNGAVTVQVNSGVGNTEIRFEKSE